MFRGGNFDRLLEKATSQLLLEPDWDATLQICDSIRQGDVTPKYAIPAIRKKVYDRNPHVSLYALQVLESVVKNCGSPVHQEIAQKEVMEEMRDLAKRSAENVRNKVLELIQVWSHAFRNEPSYRVVQDTYQIMKMEGCSFPELRESDAMFAAEKAPEWKDGDVCHRCRVQFGMVQRKHHCRACGQVFCGKCSSKNSIIPKFGIEKEVRVCDSCFEELNNVPGLLSRPSAGKAAGKTGENDLPPEYLNSPLSQQSQMPPSQKDLELQEREELELAIALSQSEAESKERGPSYKNYNNYSSVSTHNSTPPASSSLYNTSSTASNDDSYEMDPELARYLNRSYWEKKQEEVKTSTTTPSAPVASEGAVANNNNVPNNSMAGSAPVGTVAPQAVAVAKISEKYQNGDVEDEDQQHLVTTLSNNLEIFNNRMKSDMMRGRHIANDTTVQSLFQALNNMHPHLLQQVKELEDKRSYYESLQDKLTQIQDARQALDALRVDYQERLRREAEERERQRQIQMAQKLELMRQKKQEYLEYQRQIALQRMQEQEREMQLRLEQQKQEQQMRQYQQQFPMGSIQQQPMPGQYPQQGLPGQLPPGAIPPQQAQSFSPPQSVEGSPLHTAYRQQPQQPGYQQPVSVANPPPQPVSHPRVAMLNTLQQQQQQFAPTTQQQMYNQQRVQGYPQQAPVTTVPTSANQGQPMFQQQAGFQQTNQPQSLPPQTQYQAPNSQPSSLPMQQPASLPQFSTGSAPSSIDYAQQQKQQQQQPQQNFNMQAMANALPPQGPPSGYVPPQPQQNAMYQQGQSIPQQGVPPHQMNAGYPMQQMAQVPPQQQQVPPQQQQGPPQQQMQYPQQAPPPTPDAVAELISFD
ncbi:hepatocyte growth factor-regulated tyrosine kinase substrate-like isoform X4 [Branchiostoma floridae x Branchiostoma belcheri]